MCAARRRRRSRAPSAWSFIQPRQARKEPEPAVACGQHRCTGSSLDEPPRRVTVVEVVGAWQHERDADEYDEESEDEVDQDSSEVRDGVDVAAPCGPYSFSIACPDEGEPGRVHSAEYDFEGVFTQFEGVHRERPGFDSKDVDIDHDGIRLGAGADAGFASLARCADDPMGGSIDPQKPSKGVYTFVKNTFVDLVDPADGQSSAPLLRRACSSPPGVWAADVKPPQAPGCCDKGLSPAEEPGILTTALGHKKRRGGCRHRGKARSRATGSAETLPSADIELAGVVNQLVRVYSVARAKGMDAEAERAPALMECCYAMRGYGGADHASSDDLFFADGDGGVFRGDPGVYIEEGNV